MASNEPYISHGRGGAANIAKDSTIYADAGITREGPEGDQGDGPWSSGRGGTGNIAPGSHPGSPAVKPVDAGLSGGQARAHREAPDHDYVPEQNVREAPDVYHTGRGGEGNLHSVDSKRGDEVHVHEGAAERLKQKLFGKQGKP